MKLLNLLQSDKELYNLLTFGIEGEHYTKTGDDRIETPYESGQGTSDDKYGLWKWIIGNTHLAYQTQAEPDGYKEWVFDEVNSTDKHSRLMGFVPDTSKIESSIAQVNAVKSEYFGSLASGSMSDWESTYNEWMEKVKAAGNEEIKAELQRQIDEFLKK